MRIMESLKEKIKESFHVFSDGTSMHGFSELYNAKSTFWKVFWVGIIGAATGVTCYQVVKATSQFMEQSTNTAINPATANDILYPPLKVCYPHWLYWVDFNKARDKGLSKSATLVGLSYLTPILSSSWFNETLAEEEFHQFYNLNAFTSLLSFFKEIALTNNILSDDITSGEFINVNNMLSYCEVLQDAGIRSQIAMQSGVKRRTAKSNVLHLSLSQKFYNDLGGEFDNDEIRRYFNNWLFNSDSLASYNISEAYWQTLIAAGMPMTILPNGYDEDSAFAITSDHNVYQIKMKLYVNSFKSTNRFPCQVGWNWLEPNTTCENTCFGLKATEIAKPPYTIEVAVTYGKQEIENVKRNNIEFFHENLQPIISTDLNVTSSFGEENQANATFFEIIETPLDPNIFFPIYRECQLQCDGLMGCKTYSYEISVKTKFKPSIQGAADVSVQYPIESEVLVMVEQDSQTWEMFVGNVGGLLGIWTGASVVSFIQLFYLCCCASSARFPFWMSRNGIKMETGTTEKKRSTEKERPKTIKVMMKK